MIKLLTITLAIIVSILGSIGALYLKKSSEKIELKLKSNLKPLLNYNLIIGMFFYFLSAALLTFLLKINEISYIYPLTSLTYVFVTIISWKYLNEKINNYKIVAISLIVFGVALVAIS